ncbi:hypothetical protein GCM10011317_24540 [Niveispirillum cyanobacteriorum]|nr:hypothetical protein GCM10011317_24540 [Niveispirillum cyanobacteriorum]
MGQKDGTRDHGTGERTTPRLVHTADRAIRAMAQANFVRKIRHVPCVAKAGFLCKSVMPGVMAAFAMDQGGIGAAGAMFGPSAIRPKPSQRSRHAS